MQAYGMSQLKKKWCISNLVRGIDMMFLLYIFIFLKCAFTCAILGMCQIWCRNTTAGA